MSSTTVRGVTVDDIEEFNHIPKARLQLRERTIEANMVKSFQLFEREGTGMCDVREVGTIVRSLGLNPTEEQLSRMIEQMEDPESTGFVRMERFVVVMKPVLLNLDFQGTLMVRDSEDLILQAFRALDKDGRGYVDSEYLKEVMTTMGEKFSSDEILEMLNAAADPETGNIKFEDYAPILALD
eukprot:PhM_4_TR2935/c0_g1_i1/m.89727